jgi:hypothetical protein
MAAQVVFVTQGASQSFFSTTVTAPFFRSTSQAVSFLNSTQTTPFFQSGSLQQAVFNSIQTTPFFQSSALAVSMFDTIETGAVKLLQLRIGDLTLNTAQSQVDVPDATGVYDPVTNPGGYNPDGDPPVSGRPERTDLFLWTVFRLWTDTGDATQTPESQAEEEDDPYVYPLTLPTETIAGEAVPIRGLYEIILIAAPFGTPYGDYQGYESLTEFAAEAEGWYQVGAGLMVDPFVINCLNAKRYEFLQGVMCGKCDTGYLDVYSVYVGMLAAMDAKQWDRAEVFYDQLKEICATGSLSCNC